MTNYTNLFTLNHKIAIYIPSTYNINENIPESVHQAWVDKAATLLSESFGGATATKCMGYWVSDTKGLVKEQPTMVFAYCEESALQLYIDKIVDFAKSMNTELKQDAIGIELDNKMGFIS